MIKKGLSIKSICEYEEIPVSEFVNSNGKSCIGYFKRINRISNVEFFKFFHDRIKATQYVGFVRAGNFCIEVYPKIFRDIEKNMEFLLYLLNYTDEIKLKNTGLGNLSDCNNSFFEVIIRIFAVNTLKLLKTDFKRDYVTKEEDINFIRGKIDIRKQIINDDLFRLRFNCRFDEFTENILLNQIIKACCLKLFSISHSSHNKKLLREILFLLGDIEIKDIILSDFDKIIFNRINENYGPIIDLCRIFLNGKNVSFESGKFETFVFMFDMNRLFEEFVFKFIKTHRKRILLNGIEIFGISEQFFVGRLFNEFRMKADILIEDIKGNSILIDTKYKVLTEEDSHNNINQSDIYQIFAYSQSQNKKFWEVILLYPLSDFYSYKSTERVLTHKVNKDEIIKLYIKMIDIRKIFDSQKVRIDTENMISEVNKVLNN